MKSKIIYLIRHGETDYNRQGIVQGSGIDAPLNDVGQAQALVFFETYQYVPFDKIYTSALQRTKQSVQSFTDLGIPTENYSGLNEISWGIMEGKVPNYQHDERFISMINAWRSGNTAYSTDGGESPDQVAQRQIKVLDIILSRPEEETILIAMHGRAIRILLAQILHLPLSEMDNFEHQNLCLYKLKYHYDTESFEVLLSNDVTHLVMMEV